MISSQSISSPNFLKGFRNQKTSKTRNTITCAVATAPAPSSSSSSTLYDVLGLQSGATCHEIKAAYRRLAREIHPDAVADHQKVESANEFIRIHSAYATLSDPVKRRSYDREVVITTAGSVRWQHSPADGGRRPVYSRSPRTWETDQCW